MPDYMLLDDLKKLKHIDYMSNKEFFYGIPFAICCIEKQIEKNLSSRNGDANNVVG